MHDRTLLQIVVPFHQPIHSSEEQMERAIQRCYAPFLRAIAGHRDVRIAVHFSGYLLDHLMRHHEELMASLRTLVAEGQIEVLGGLFYGGIPALLPESDVRGQIEMTGEFWESNIGLRPQGFWLPDLAWSVEVPSLLQDSGLEYGFACASQLKPHGKHRGLGLLERGGQRTGVFEMDPVLSAALPWQEPDPWVDAVLDRASSQQGRITTIWVRAELFGSVQGTHARCIEKGWLEEWLACIGGGRSELYPILPSAAFGGTRPAVGVSLRPGLPPELKRYGFDDCQLDWNEYTLHSSELNTLYRRIIQASEKLREAIAHMEEEEMEDSWSDVLATAQRLIFAAQGGDLFWRGAAPGFCDPAVRTAVARRIIDANRIVDDFLQSDDWMTTEEEDKDGDLVDEMFVATGLLSVWLVPANGGTVRAIDDRLGRRNILDVPSRRVEPFFEEMEQAPLANQRGNGGSSIGLVRLQADLPTTVDAAPRYGIRTWLFDAGTTLQDYDSGTAVDLLQSERWRVAASSIHEDTDYSYGMELLYQGPVGPNGRDQVTIQKELTIPIDESRMSISYEASLAERGDVLLVTEIPIRLDPGPVGLGVNGQTVPSEPCEFERVEGVTVTGKRSEKVEVQISPVADVWCLPIDTSLRTSAGFRRVSQGIVLMIATRLETAVSAQLTLRMGGSSRIRVKLD